MSFLKSMWKNGKHKKLNEEMVLTSSLRDFVESPLDFNDEELSDDPIVYNLKYLGCTMMSSTANSDEEKQTKKPKFNKKSQLITTSAIKRVLAASKSQKKLKEVTISISPRGILAHDQLTDDKVVEVPIHRISYCSIDAAHDTIFSFVSSPETNSSGETKSADASQHFGSPDSPVGQLESSSLEDDEGLVLHAFQCQKRKVAHNVTMSVARSFERAYQIYQNEQFLREARSKTKNIDKENFEAHKNALNIKNIMVGRDEQQLNGCLIDFDADSGPELDSFKTKDTKDYFQTTWVSFD